MTRVGEKASILFCQRLDCLVEAMAHPNAPGWGQTLGALLAIFATWLIATSQARRDEKRRARELRRMVLLPVKLADEAQALIKSEFQRCRYVDRPKFEHAPPQLQHLIRLLAQIDLKSTPNLPLLISVLDLIALLSRVEASYEEAGNGLTTQLDPDTGAQVTRSWIELSLCDFVAEISVLTGRMRQEAQATID